VASVYDSERLAAAYAFDRPPVHQQILRSALLERRAHRALDVGCGAGLSTAAVAPLAEQVFGLEPVPAMLAHCRAVAPRARFVIGAAERLPFGPELFDLVTAAGSLNYADLPPALSEIARVLTPGGRFLLYDFSEGRRSPDGDELADWFAAFEQRFPWPAGWRSLDPRALPLAGSGLRLLEHTDIELRLPTTFDAYLRYAAGGLNVDSAITRGASSAEEARDWCQATLAPVFAAGDVTVTVPGYLATLSRARDE
jgi:ubiquinone/menaquinone biosynthesis C-methylase UbiE